MRKMVTILGFAALAMAAAAALDVSAVLDLISTDAAQVNPPLMYAGIRG